MVKKKMFDNYETAVKSIKGKKGSFAVFQIPRDKKHRFEVKKI